MASLLFSPDIYFILLVGKLTIRFYVILSLKGQDDKKARDD